MILNNFIKYVKKYRKKSENQETELKLNRKNRHTWFFLKKSKFSVRTRFQWQNRTEPCTPLSTSYCTTRTSENTNAQPGRSIQSYTRWLLPSIADNDTRQFYLIFLVAVATLFLRPQPPPSSVTISVPPLPFVTSFNDGRSSPIMTIVSHRPLSMYWRMILISILHHHFTSRLQHAMAVLLGHG